MHSIAEINNPVIQALLFSTIAFTQQSEFITDVFVSEHYHIFVGDLSPEIETQTLREAFSVFGEIS